MGAREVSVGCNENRNKKVQYKNYSDIEDGVYAQKTYRMIELRVFMNRATMLTKSNSISFIS